MRTTMLALVAVFGGAVAGCATGTGGPDDPIVVTGKVTCADVAELTGIDVGAYELTMASPASGVHRFDPVGPFEITLTPRTSSRLDFLAPREVRALIVERGATSEIYVHEPDAPGAFEVGMIGGKLPPFALRICWER